MHSLSDPISRRLNCIPLIAPVCGGRYSRFLSFPNNFPDRVGYATAHAVRLVASQRIFELFSDRCVDNLTDEHWLKRQLTERQSVEYASMKIA
jgi:hypothetical protein